MSRLRALGTSFSFLLTVLFAGCGGGGSATPLPPGPPADEFATGLLLSTPAELERMPKALPIGAAGPLDLPSTVTLSSLTALPRAGDQGRQPSCGAWAVGYGLASYSAARSTNADVSLTSNQGSPADMYAKIIQAQGSTCNDGTQLNIAMSELVSKGIASMAASPYEDAYCVPPVGGQIRIRSFHAVDTKNPAAIKKELSEGRVLAFGMTLPSSPDLGEWGMGSGRNGVYRGISGNAGGHAMLLVGYDDSLGAWHVMNSWGTNWGSNGLFWLDYSTFEQRANSAFVADGGEVFPVEPDPTPDPNIPPTFNSLTAYQLFDYYTLQGLLIMDFSLSEPFFVTGGRMSFADGAVEYLDGQYYYSGYVWFATPPGFYWGGDTYTLTLFGLTESGQPTSISKSVILPEDPPEASIIRPGNAGLGGNPLNPATTRRRLTYSPGLTISAQGHDRPLLPN